MHELIVKISSMGDIIHALPAVTDATIALPGIKFDWVIEEAFIEIPTWCRSVSKVIPIALRRWRKNIWHNLKQREFQKFYQLLRINDYNNIIDAQGSIKSAIITYLGCGYRIGLDKKSIREILADLAYQKKIYVSRTQHAIDRNRQLFAKALGYAIPTTPPDYCIDKKKLIFKKFNLPKNYLVFVPNTSKSIKYWPDVYWDSLAEQAEKEKILVFIPWGTEKEKNRAQKICTNRINIKILPWLTLSEIAYILLHAKLIISVDTGLSHLAAALNTPTITLYGPTNPKFIGTVGPLQFHASLNDDAKIIWKLIKNFLIKIN